ncbi:MAG: hypothetical protein OXE95_10910 [Chloroflexi bacterium]|nr:hypothetical protein [Chloroflexota bacterium]MCY4248067.1 hypothetical protein [Chloroflexota bacterium]
MGDAILILGGCAFWVLSGLCWWRRDLVWRLYSLEPRWRADNPERTAAWEAKTRRSAYVFALAGLVFVALGVLI